MMQVNQALESSDPSATLRALQNPRLDLPSVLPGARTLYHEELRNMKAEKQVDLVNLVSSCMMWKIS